MKTSLLLVSLGLLLNASAFKFMGVNEAGAEFGSNIPGVYMVDYTFPRTSSIDYMISSGMNIIRLPFLWERIQPQLGGSFDPTYLGYITTTVNYITVTKGAYVLLDVHNYARYNNVPIGQGVAFSDFQNLWIQLAGQFKSNPNVVFGLMNEPNTMPYSDVYNAMQAAINGIRSTGATNLITVPGNDWTGAHSWMAGDATSMANITDPLNNFMFEMHQYFDNNFSGNGACNTSFDPSQVFAPATAWLRSMGKTAFLGEFGIENTPGCLAVLDNTMAYLQANSDVWTAYTWWAAGPWWGSYKFSLESGVGNAQMAILQKYMSNSPSTPVPTAPTSVTTGSNQPSITGSNQPIVNTPATTGRVKVASTTGSNQPSTTGVNSNGGSSVPPSTTVNCTIGNMKCLSSSTFSTCGWGVWGAAQTCGSQTVCSPNGNYIYCVKGSSSNAPSTTAAVAAAPVPSAPTPAAPTPAAPVPVVAPVAPTPAAPATTGSQSSSCSLGQLRCVSETQYQTCGNAVNGYAWSVAQSCAAGLQCHPFGQQIYCY